MGQLRALGYGMLRAALGLRREPGAVFKATLALAIAFLLVGLAHWAGRTVVAATSAWNSAHMVVYLEDGTSAERARQIMDALATLPAVERAEYVMPDDALPRLREALGGHGELVEGLEAGMLPASIEITFRSGVDDVAATYPVVQRLEATEGVEEVEFAGEWVDRVSTLLAGLRYAGWVLLLIVVSVAGYIVAMVIGARIESRRAEAEVMSLLGASSAFVRGPLMLEGAIQGAAGAGLAALGLWLLFRAGADAVREVLGAAFGSAPVAFLPLAHIALFIAGGAILGALGSWLAARRYAFC